MDPQPISKKPAIRPPSLTGDVVTVEFGDGVEYPLNYQIHTLQRVKERLGVPMTGIKGSLLTLDESVIPVLIFEGLCNKDGVAPDGVTLERIENLPARFTSYLMLCFTAAYSGSLPQKKIDQATMAALREMVSQADKETATELPPTTAAEVSAT